MNIELFGRLYTAALSLYFLASGLLALSDVDAKLARIGLAAIDNDGKTAFILIYCSLMVGIAAVMLLLYYLSKSWQYSAITAVTVIVSFICFRFIAALMQGEFSSVQIGFIATEMVEVAIGLGLVIKSKFLVHTSPSRA